ncbi:hypothetical protein [Candidatus Contubernalis alkaliaceticus]|uniref:hypothetical protein n=1 Tax=Candidatus Contubernalis alkaliaceticus TaxID=338645 RepID=UPI001F4BD51B|nr:hypothetical protein [Candidatus Contubernalis alkalaceticus]UNC93539.1 hypothetical protein HUE98_16520 [Candidatus Contubernalis alkalaceticus]
MPKGKGRKLPGTTGTVDFILSQKHFSALKLWGTVPGREILEIAERQGPEAPGH